MISKFPCNYVSSRDEVAWHSEKTRGSGVRQTWVWILAVPFTSCVILNKTLNFPDLDFLICKMSMTTRVCDGYRLSKVWNEVTDTKYLIQCLTHSKPIINIRSFAYYFWYLLPPLTPALPSPEPVIGRAENVAEGQAESKSSHDLTTFSWFNGRTTPQQDQGEGAKGVVPEVPALFAK